MNNESLRDSLINYSADTLTNDNKRRVLTATLWRDFFPPAPNDGRPLIAYVLLENLDSTKISKYLKFTWQFVINGNQLWTSSCTPSSVASRFSFPPPDYIMAGVSLNGPKWGRNIFVTVVAEVIDSSSGKIYWIRTVNRQIQMTI